MTETTKGPVRKLDASLLEKVREYISLYHEDGYFQKVKKLPSEVGLAQHIGVTKMTVNRWKKQLDEVAVEFAELMEEIHDLQHECLVNSSLFDEINARVATVILGKHGYSSRVENTLQGPNGGPVAVTSVSFVSAFDEDPEAV
jgi:hypothetical protein